MTMKEAPPVAGVPACTPRLTDPDLEQGAAERLAARLNAIAHSARLRLVSMVSAHESTEACVCDLTEPLGLSQGTVSHHLRILVEAGILAREKRGTWSYYSLVPGALNSIAASVSNL